MRKSAANGRGKRIHLGETEQEGAGVLGDLVIDAPFGSHHANASQAFPQLLGNSVPVQGLAYADGTRANGVSSVGASPDKHRSTPSQTRIERAANRDPVGDQLPTGKTPKCSFPGVVSIEPKRFLDSGVLLVECPDCARTRSLSPHNGVLRFPSHDKRKTRTPSTDRRWAMGKTTWEVVGG